jgi:cbb3-type cytochrome oxidase subunit 3
MDITPGHWVFAAIFMLVFITGIVWSFRKDRTVNRRQFGNTNMLALIIGGGILLLIILKFALRFFNKH